MSVTDPRASDEDLTAKARIRNAALDLYAEHGEDRVSMRAVAAAAGVAVGLVQHHFKTKDGLRVAVEQLVVDYYALAIASSPNEGTPAQVAAARDEAVRHMLATHPTVVNYIRRAVLDPQGKSELLERLTDLSRREISKLRYSGKTLTRRSESSQVIGLMVRQLGQLLMQPMIDDMWDYLDRTGAPHGDKPTISVTVI
ncbi:TetR family transcriptional regulator [Williamsia muralis]|uniref:TetR/AcrR family transcriptional regulator n=1 Tax=Williamsia marianensis TaxID=85044 RepID=UPI003F16EBFB